MNRRYTMLLEFEGGTHVSQVAAADELRATLAWPDTLRLQRTLGPKSENLTRLMAQSLEEDGVVALDGLIDVWCLTSLVRGKLALLNIVGS